MMKMVCAVLLLLTGVAAEAQSLKGSKASMRKQFDEAKKENLTRLKNPAEVEKFEDLGLLTELRGSNTYKVEGASFPVARSGTKLFVNRFSYQFKRACGEELVVTSLTRPLNKQPRNASKLSVHPAGMSVDFRVPSEKKCVPDEKGHRPNAREWLEHALLTLETAGVLEATREKHPKHYHVAVFPAKYRAYLKARQLPAPAKAPPVAKAARKR